MSDAGLDEALARHVRLSGMATEEQLAAARTLAAAEAVPLAEALVRQGVITPIQRDNVEKKIGALREHANELGGFKIVKKLGEGGMGAVYLAEEPSSRRRVALKVLPKRNAQDPEFVQRFRREAEAATKLDHPNIVRAYSAGEDKGYHFIVMEYCEGESLKKRIERSKFLPHPDAAEIVVQVARGLEAAHAAGFIHRDIKPENIMLAPTGAARILDLGLAKNLTDTQDSLRTETGAALGTPHYISPEQARGDRGIDGRTDLYSLGATFYHALTGATPFSGSSIFEVIQKHLMEQLPDPRDLRPDIPEPIVHVLRKLMAKSPADRYRDAAELLIDLDRVRVRKAPLTRAIDPALSSIARPLATAAPRSRKKFAIAGLSASLLTAVAIIAWPASKTPVEAPPPPPPIAKKKPEKRAEEPKVEAPRAEPPAVPPEAPKNEPPPRKIEDPKPPPPEPKPPEPVKPLEPEPELVVAPPVKPVRSSVPDEAKQREATAALQKQFAAEYAKAAPSDRLDLSRRLLELEAGDPVANFVRLREARDLAARSGHGQAALSVIERMGDAFVIDALPMRADALAAAAGAARTKEALTQIAQRSLEVMQEAIASDRFEIATRLDAKAQAAAADAKNPELAAEIKAAGKQASDWLGQFPAPLRAAKKTLEEKPADPAANLALGRFYIMVKEDWEKGLEMLARGAEDPLKGLAEKELREPKDAETRIDLCTGWLALAQKETFKPRKTLLTERARLWFEQTKGDLKESQRKDLEKALGTAPAPAVAKPKPAAKAPAAPVPLQNGFYDLLPIVDVARHSVNGAWQRTSQGLVSPAGGTNGSPPRLWIPYSPPDEYEIFLTVERVQGDEDLVLAFVHKGRPFAVVLDGWGAEGASGAYVNGRWEKNPRVQPHLLPAGKPIRIGCFIRGGGFNVTVDSRQCNLAYPNLASLGMPDYLKIPGQSDGLVLATVRSSFKITSLTTLSWPKEKVGTVIR